MGDIRLGKDRKCWEKLSLPASGQRPLTVEWVISQAMHWVSTEEQCEVQRRCDWVARVYLVCMKPQAQNPSTP